MTSKLRCLKTVGFLTLKLIGFGMKNRFRNISNFLNLDYFEKIKIMIIMEILMYSK